MGALGGLEGHTAQSVFTVVARVRPERTDAVRDVLAAIAADPETNNLLPLGALGGLHYATLVLHDADPERPLLVLEANVDGEVDALIDDLVERAGEGVDELWGSCVDYPATPATRAQRRSFLRGRVVLPGAYHVGTTGRSRGTVLAEAELREAIADFVDGHRRSGTLPATSLGVREAVIDHIGGRPDLAWALSTPPTESMGARLRRFRFLARSSDRGLVAPVAGLLVVGALAAWRWPLRTLAVAVLGAGTVALLFRRLESREVADDRTVPDDLLDRVEMSEDASGVVTNHLASLVDLKPRRRTLLRGVLLVIDVAARVTYTKGRLGSIPTIHFAHWSVVDGGRRLLFVSNYDGSWESYLDDFIEKAASGLSAVWSNTANFPPATWLGIRAGSGGARRGPEFKRMARNSQSPTTIRYCAYPSLSVTNVWDNSALRAGLRGQMDEEEAWTWLSRL